MEIFTGEEIRKIARIADIKDNHLVYALDCIQFKQKKSGAYDLNVTDGRMLYHQDDVIPEGAIPKKRGDLYLNANDVLGYVKNTDEVWIMGEKENLHLEIRAKKGGSANLSLHKTPSADRGFPDVAQLIPDKTTDIVITFDTGLLRTLSKAVSDNGIVSVKLSLDENGEPNKEAPMLINTYAPADRVGLLMPCRALGD